MFSESVPWTLWGILMKNLVWYGAIILFPVLLFMKSLSSLMMLLIMLVLILCVVFSFYFFTFFFGYPLHLGWGEPFTNNSQAELYVLIHFFGFGMIFRREKVIATSWSYLVAMYLECQRWKWISLRYEKSDPYRKMVH